jgi:hypothetical protein
VGNGGEMDRRGRRGTRGKFRELWRGGENLTKFQFNIFLTRFGPVGKYWKVY